LIGVFLYNTVILYGSNFDCKQAASNLLMTLQNTWIVCN